MKHRLWKLDIGHAQIADRRAKRGVVDAHPDHYSERIEAVEQPLAVFGFFCKMSVDMQRLRIHRQQAEHRIIHLGDGPGRTHDETPDRVRTPRNITLPSASPIVWRPLLHERIQSFLTIFRCRDESKALGSVFDGTTIISI